MTDIMLIRARSACAVTAKYAGKIGNVQGDKKLRTPAANERKIKTRIPDLGRMGFA